MYPSKNDIIGELQPFKNEWNKIVNDQVTGDIIDAIMMAHKRHVGDYDRMVELFFRERLYASLKAIFSFLKENTQYVAESDTYQTVRSPMGLLNSTLGVDCKHYSLFIGGLVDAYNRLNNVGLKWFYRFASYDGSKTPGHVFVVVVDPVTKDEIWIDPVLDYFNEKKRYNFKIDFSPYKDGGEVLSGINKKCKSVRTGYLFFLGIFFGLIFLNN
jgi:hypothetical protein